MSYLAHLATLGLVHCDFNEFNLLIDDNEHITIIDFPQMVSVRHPNAQELFYRDVDSIIRFFRAKLGIDPDTFHPITAPPTPFPTAQPTHGSPADVTMDEQYDTQGMHMSDSAKAPFQPAGYDHHAQGSSPSNYDSPSGAYAQQ